jgi:hypothetical protein
VVENRELARAFYWLYRLKYVVNLLLTEYTKVV